MDDSPTVVDPAEPPQFLGVGLVDADITIFPHQREGDAGVYREQLIDVAKALRASGAVTKWQDATDQRLWYGERSATSDIILPIILGVVSNAGWDGIKRVLGSRGGRVKLKLGYRKGVDGGETRWLDYDGDSSDLPAVLGRLDPWRSAALPSEQPEPEDQP